MPGTLFIDTDVIIDYLRGQADAVAYLESLTENQFLSAVTVAELYAGVREGDERRILDAFVGAFEIAPIDETIAVNGGLYRRDYSKSHNAGLADAMIAASTEAHSATLVTLNKKHFPMLANVYVPYRKS